MRYSKTHKQETRERVLTIAARALRARGPERVGVAEVMAEAGLTHGGFYAHFKSRDDLLAAAVEAAFEDGRALWASATAGMPGVEGLARYVDRYVSAGHRDRIDTGCPIAALGADFARSRSAAAEGFRTNFQRLLGAMADQLPGDDALDRATRAASLFAEMMGAVLVARAMGDQPSSDRLLETARNNLRARIGASSTAGPKAYE